MITNPLTKIKTIKPIQILILFFICILTIAIVKFFGKQAEWHLIKIQVVGKDWTENYVNYSGYRPPYWLTKSIEPGDIEYGADGTVNAEVIKIEKYPRGGPEYDLYLILKIKGVLNTRTNQYIYKSRAVEVGGPINLNLNHALIIAQVIDDNYPKEGYPTKEIIITGRLRNTEPWLYNNINIGDEMTNGNQNEIIATILDIQTEPAQSQLIASQSKSGNISISNNPRLKDVIVTAKIVVELHQQQLYFGSHQLIKIGNSLWLVFPQINLSSIEIESITDTIPDENT